MNKKVYHLTNPRNVEGIKENGLKCSDDGYVYVVEDVMYTNPYTSRKNNTFNEIACGQIFQDKYTAIEVDTDGLDVEGYDEGEYVCQWCYRIKADVIPTERLTFGKTYKSVPQTKVDRLLINLYKDGTNRPLVEKRSTFKANIS